LARKIGVSEDLSSPTDFFHLAHENFLSSANGREEVRIFYKIAGFAISLVFAGRELVDSLTSALAHLKTEPSEHPDFTLCVWDSPHGELPWSPYSVKSRGEVDGYNTDQIYTVLDVHTKVLHLFDKRRHLALYWVKDRTQLPWWIGGSPLQLLFHWWLRDRGIQLTHAAAVGYSKGAVLLAGKSGSGKSTTSLSCMKAGMSYLSEDYCLLTDLPDIWVHTIYNSAKIEERTLQQFPELEKQIENPHRKKGDKGFLFHSKFQPEKILQAAPLKALLTLKIEARKESYLEPIFPDEAIGPLSISTMWQLTHTGPTVFNHLKRVAQSLPCYRLHLGSDLEDAPHWIEELL